MRQGVMVLALLMLAVGVLADTVETIDGVLWEGSRLTGLPSTIVLQDDSVTISIDSGKILAMEIGDELVQVTTTSGMEFAGILTTALEPLTLKTETGEVEVPSSKVTSITFTRRAVEKRSYSARITLTDGLVFEGDLTRAFPSEIVVDSGGLSIMTELRSISLIQLSDPAIVYTASALVEGTLVTALPDEVELKTSYGAFGIPKGAISEIAIVDGKRISSVEGGSDKTLGVGLKVWGGLPTVLGNLQWGHLGIEVGAGLGAMALPINIGDMTAFWYYANVRYLIGIPFVEEVFLPYFGAGVVGLTLAASSGGASASATIFGVDAFAGIEFSLGFLNIPVTLFAGVDWTMLGESADVVTLFGARVDFPL